MNYVYFTVGPSQIYPTVYKHLQNAINEGVLSWSHRGVEFRNLFTENISLLKEFLNIPKTHEIFYLSSGTEGMERFIQNCVEKNLLHVITGSFGGRFYQTAQELNRTPSNLKFAENDTIDLTKINAPNDTEAICVTHNDTSTGVEIDLKDLYKIKKQNPKVLTAVDVVSSLPNGIIDFKYIDCAFFSVQKGFGLPAGLGIIIISKNSLAKAKSLQKRGQYWHFS